jgi:hypothetical protein
LIDQIERAAAEYKVLLVEWDDAKATPRVANKLFDRNHTVYKQLRETEAGRQAIIRLLTDDNVAVRMTAAVESLAWVPDDAVPVLEEIEKHQSLYGVTAKYSLIAYRKGSLNLDW